MLLEQQPLEYTLTVLDFETTGLKEKEGHIILECAAIHVDFDTLAVLDTFDEVVGQANWSPARGEGAKPLTMLMDPFALDMHTKNGLLDEVLEAAADPEHKIRDAHDLQVALSQWFAKASMRTNGANSNPAHNIVLCGNSIHFDRGFMLHHMPQLDIHLFHRMVDVSSFILVYKKWCGELPPVDKAHRAMADCEMSLKTLRFMREFFKSAADQSAVRRSPLTKNPEEV